MINRIIKSIKSLYKREKLTTQHLYAIKNGYKHRVTVPHFDDTSFTDQYQLNVYKKALSILKINKFQSVVDYGCGSAYKLVKLFSDYKITGVEVDPTLAWLKTKYPSVNFLSPEEFNNNSCDVLICADVIEHVKNPDQFLSLLIKTNAKYFIISTPARELLSKSSQQGPPNNIHHYREWTVDEFNQYLKNHFEIKEHYICNKGNATQLAVCSLKLN